MKRLIAVIAALLLSSTAFADPFYFGAGVGQSKVKDNGFCSAVDAILDPGASCSQHDTDTAVKIFGGMVITPNLAVELGYVDFGKFDGNASGTFFGTPTSVSGDVKVHAWTVSGVGMLPVANQLSLLGRLGIAFWNVDESASANVGGFPGSASTSASGNDLTFGLGAHFDINKQTALRGEWERYKNVGDSDTGQSDIDLVSVSILVKF